MHPSRPPRRAARGLWLLLALLPLLGHRGIAQVPPATTLAFAPTADTYVDSGSPTANFNTDVRLRAKGPAARMSYLRFLVTGVGTRHVQQARLRLAVTGAASSAGTIHRITNTTWNEATVTYDTRPAIDGAGIQTLGTATAGQILEFNLDTTVTGDGVYSFAIDTVATDTVSYASMAATSGQKPSLVLTVTTTTPTVTIVQPPDASSFFTGDPITLQGQASDGAGGNLSSRIVWTSNLAGTLGTGAIV